MPVAVLCWRGAISERINTVAVLFKPVGVPLSAQNRCRFGAGLCYYRANRHRCRVDGAVALLKSAKKRCRIVASAGVAIERVITVPCDAPV